MAFHKHFFWVLSDCVSDRCGFCEMLHTLLFILLIDWIVKLELETCTAFSIFGN